MATLLLGSIAMAQADHPLAGYRWQNRVVLLFADAANHHDLALQRQLLAASRDGVRDRDLVVIAVANGTVDIGGAQTERLAADALRDSFEVPPDDFRVLLIGKDGGVKLSSDEPISSKNLFALIDSMPMRRSEMRERATPDF